MKNINFLELAEKFVKGEISVNDPQIVEAEKVLSEMASTEQGLKEIAEVIAMYLDENFNKFDISKYLCTYRNFKLGDKPEFRLKKKGVKAYWIAPNSSTPKSRNYQETLGMEFDSLSVRPECTLDEIQAGRIQGFADLIKDAREALEDAIAEKVFTLLGQVYNETVNANNYDTCTTTLSQTVLDNAIDYIFYKTGQKPTIIGDMMLVNQITKFTGFSDKIVEEIQRTGKLGTYRGCSLLQLPEIINPSTGKSMIPTKKLFLVSSKIGYAGTYGNPKVGQESSIEDWSWNMRMDKEWGFTVTDPKGLFVIEVL